MTDIKTTPHSPMFYKNQYHMQNGYKNTEIKQNSEKTDNKRCEKDLKEYKTNMWILGGCSIASFLTMPLISKEYKKTNLIGGIIFAIGALIMPIFKPKMEKYTQSAGMKLNKEI